MKESSVLALQSNSDQSVSKLHHRLSTTSSSSSSSSSLSSCSSTFKSCSSNEHSCQQFKLKKGVRYKNDGSMACCKFCEIAYYGIHHDEVIYEDKDICIFIPLFPSSDVHYLIVPKIHLRSIHELKQQHVPLLEKMHEIGLDLFHEKNKNFAMKKRKERILKEDDDTDEIEQIGEPIFAFHVPPFNSIDHLHMHVLTRTKRSCLQSVKYMTGTFWCRSYQEVIDRILIKSSSSCSAPSSPSNMDGCKNILCRQPTTLFVKKNSNDSNCTYDTDTDIIESNCPDDRLGHFDDVLDDDINDCKYRKNSFRYDSNSNKNLPQTIACIKKLN